MPLKNSDHDWEKSLIHLSPEGIKKLKDELAQLKRALPARIEETARTAAYGDRSDNAEYKMAKGALRFTHRRILELEDQLKRAVVIPTGEDASGKIHLGSTVRLRAKDGTERAFRILGPQEADVAKGFISEKSPLGAGLIGRRRGETVIIQTPSGSQEYEILE
ncbi:MAG TPA: transcription elongation factor GreA [Candidatus Paceibacterota bacterium]|nr:transcription elongation factor GreA [Candidatus Paceibacterota bacterium]